MYTSVYFKFIFSLIAARRYALFGVRPSVRPSVCPSVWHVRILYRNT